MIRIRKRRREKRRRRRRRRRSPRSEFRPGWGAQLRPGIQLSDQNGGLGPAFLISVAIAIPSPSLRAKRSNPWGGKGSMDCFVASLLAMTEVVTLLPFRKRQPHPERGKTKRKTPAQPGHHPGPGDDAVADAGAEQ